MTKDNNTPFRHSQVWSLNPGAIDLCLTIPPVRSWKYLSSALTLIITNWNIPQVKQLVMPCEEGIFQTFRIWVVTLLVQEAVKCKQKMLHSNQSVLYQKIPITRRKLISLTPQTYATNINKTRISYN